MATSRQSWLDKRLNNVLSKGEFYVYAVILLGIGVAVGKFLL